VVVVVVVVVVLVVDFTVVVVLGVLTFAGVDIVEFVVFMVDEFGTEIR
jgi:hypothetical protein